MTRSSAPVEEAGPPQLQSLEASQEEDREQLTDDESSTTSPPESFSASRQQGGDEEEAAECSTSVGLDEQSDGTGGAEENITEPADRVHTVAVDQISAMDDQCIVDIGDPWQRVDRRRRRQCADQSEAPMVLDVQPLSDVWPNAENGRNVVGQSQRELRATASDPIEPSACREVAGQSQRELRAVASDPVEPGVKENSEGVEARLLAIQRLARGWQSFVWAAEASSDGSRLDLWQARRNENAAWRLEFLERNRRGGPAPAVEADDDVAACSCLACGGPRLCTCCPDPWRHHPQLSSTSAGGSDEPELNDALSIDAEEVVGLDNDVVHRYSTMAAPLGSALGWAALGKPCTPWRQLLAQPADAKATSGASASRRRRENAAWRQWWAAQAAHQHEAAWPEPAFLFAATPTSTYPGTPRGEADHGHLAVQARVEPNVLVPVPQHLVAQVQQYVAQLLAAEAASVGSAA